MKLKYLLLGLLSLILFGCGDDTKDTLEPPKPNNPNQPTEPTEEYADWYVMYNEISWQNPTWESRVNTSKECVDWKEANLNNLWEHYSQGDKEEWVWYVTYKNETESEVAEKAERFVKWTLDKEDVGSEAIGIDTYIAKVTKAKADYYTIYSYTQNFDTSTNNGYNVKFREHKVWQPGKSLPTPSGYEEWVRDNKSALTEEHVYSYSADYVWTFHLSEITSEYFENNILPFVRWSYIEELLIPYENCDEFSVSITKNGTGLSKSYYKEIVP